ncbi:hypothetical protein D3C75_1007550 [compost metagenome]
MLDDYTSSIQCLKASAPYRLKAVIPQEELAERDIVNTKIQSVRAKDVHFNTYQRMRFCFIRPVLLPGLGALMRA